MYSKKVWPKKAAASSLMRSLQGKRDNDEDIQEEASFSAWEAKYNNVAQ